MVTDYTLGANLTGTNFRTELNDILADIAANSPASGTRPTYLPENGFWVDTSGGSTRVLYFYDGTDNIRLCNIDTTNNLAHFSGGIFYGSDSGSNDTYVISATPTAIAYYTGMRVLFKANTVNTGTATINVDSLGAKTITRDNGATLETGDIAANMWILLVYDGTNFRCLSTLQNSTPVNAQTGTTYTVDTTDRGKLVTFTNGSSIAVTQPQAGTNFPAGWYTFFQNRGAGVVTITPTTSTVDGAASITLSQNQGLMLASDGTNYFTMRGRGITSRADSFAGSILQVVQTVKTDTFTTSSTSFTDVTGMSVTITPTDTTNQVLIRAVLQYSTNATPILQVRLLRGATEIASGTAAGSRTTAAAAGFTGGSSIMQCLVIEFLDSPASISAQTYKIQFRASTANNVHLNRTDSDIDSAGSARTASTITAMEVAV